MNNLEVPQENQIVPKEPSILKIEMNIDKMVAMVHGLDEFYRKIMKKETDYGIIPGTTKPTLYKAGAEMLCMTFNLRAEVRIVAQVEDLDKPYFDYTVKCTLYTVTDGLMRGEGLGNTNTGETRYATRKGRDSTRDELFTLKNTVLKMAEKRAFIDAVLRVTGASRIFTQDLEDNPSLVDDDDSYKPPPLKPTTTKPASSPIVAGLKEATRPVGVTASVELQRPISPQRLDNIPLASETWHHTRMGWLVTDMSGSIKDNEPLPCSGAHSTPFIFLHTQFKKQNMVENTHYKIVKSSDNEYMVELLVAKMTPEVQNIIEKALTFILTRNYNCDEKDVTVTLEVLEP